jgi:hypothetical protein
MITNIYYIPELARRMINHKGTNPEDGFAPWTCIGRRFLLGSQYCIEKLIRESIFPTYIVYYVLYLTKLAELNRLLPLLPVTY